MWLLDHSERRKRQRDEERYKVDMYGFVGKLCHIKSMIKAINMNIVEKIH